jgi:anti-sigma B factor antagonist
MPVLQRGHLRFLPENWPRCVMSALLVRTSNAQAPPTVVTVAGEIDIATVPALRRHLVSLPGCSTIVELSGVQLLSAAGLTELVDLHDRLTRAGVDLVLATATASVRRVLAITGLDDTVLLADTLDDAVHLLTTPIPQRPPPRSLSATRSCGYAAKSSVAARPSGRATR